MFYIYIFRQHGSETSTYYYFKYLVFPFKNIRIFSNKQAKETCKYLLFVKPSQNKKTKWNDASITDLWLLGDNSHETWSTVCSHGTWNYLCRSKCKLSFCGWSPLVWPLVLFAFFVCLFKSKNDFQNLFFCFFNLRTFKTEKFTNCIRKIQLISAQELHVF